MRAIEWINRNLRCASNLNADALNEVNDFTLLWGLFEGVECEADARKHRFEAYCKSYSGKVDISMIKEALSYWRQRYSSEGKPTPEYQNLRLRNSDAKSAVDRVIFENNNDTYEVVLALLTIIYRLRNNLFHGLKTIDALSLQAENFRYANQIIMALLPLSGKYIFLDAAA